MGTTSHDAVPTAGQPAGSMWTLLPAGTLAALCWQGTAAERRRAHAQHGRRFCPTHQAPYGEKDPLGRAIHSVCVVDECIDTFHDVLAETSRRLTRRWAGTVPPSDPARYTTALIPTVLADRRRSARVAKGWPAKPGRADGKGAIVNAHLLAAAADEATGAWHVALFRILQYYVHSASRASTRWPVDGLAQERTRHFGDTCREPAVVLADIQLVLDLAAQAVGGEWVHRHIWHPLLSGATPRALTEDLLARGGELEDQVLTGWFRDEYVKARADGVAPHAAYRQAGRTISGRDVPAPDAAVRRALKELEFGATFATVKGP